MSKKPQIILKINNILQKFIEPNEIINKIKIGSFYTLQKTLQFSFTIFLTENPEISKNRKHFYICGGSNLNGNDLFPFLNKITKVPLQWKEETDFITTISLGNNHLLILTKNGHVYGFGNNFNYQLGLPKKKYLNQPIKLNVNFYDKIKKIKAGNLVSYFITSTNALYGCGSDENGQLGLQKLQNCKTPMLLMENVKIVKCGMLHTIVETLNGNFYAIGKNFDGQLCLGNNNFYFGFKKITICKEKIQKFKCGGYFTVFLTVTGNVYIYGKVCDFEDYNNNNDNNGYFYNNNKNSGIYIEEPFILNNFKNIYCGLNYIYFIDYFNKIFIFGSNEKGQLGLESEHFNNNFNNNNEIVNQVMELKCLNKLNDGCNEWKIATNYSSQFTFLNGKLGVDIYLFRKKLFMNCVYCDLTVYCNDVDYEIVFD
ncbi:hypothetical protein ABK040_007054 [Willaertia magna]